MAEGICPSCGAWRFGPQDRFCGNCGESLLRARAEITPALVYSDQQVGQIDLCLFNVGSGSLAGSQLELRAAATGQVLWRELIPEGALRANDGSRLHLTLPLADLGADGRPQCWELRHRVQPGVGTGRLLGLIRTNLAPPQPALAETAIALAITELDRPPALDTALVLRIGSASDGAEVGRVHCESPFDGMPAPQVGALALPCAIAAGTDWRLPLTLSAELMRLLVNQPEGVIFNLVIGFSGREAQEKDRPVRIPFLLRVPSPARPQFRLLHRRFVGMAGSEIRLQAEVHNRGGEPCRLGESRLAVTKGPQQVRALTLKTPGRQQPLRPGERRRIEVPLVLDFAAVAAGSAGELFALDWEQGFDGELPAGHGGATIEVHAPREFQGIVAMDFGTTASAVAVHAHGEQVPVLVNLGDGVDHLPTAILYELDDQGSCRWLIGDEAVARLGELGADYRYYFDNLKLHLHSRERQLLPDGRQRSWAGIAADYLRTLRARLEGHPGIAARIREVHPTHPASFPPLATDALLAAYREAGMEPRRYRLRDGGQVVMSESWPQVLLRLPLPQLTELIQRAFGDNEPPGEESPRFGVLSFDVGGGTTDMSVFQVEVRTLAEIDIQELGTESDFGLCGIGFSRLIANGLVKACDAWFQRQGLEPTALAAPFVLPWDERVSGTTPLQLDNGRAIAELALRLQHQKGPLAGLRERIEPVAKQEYWATVSAPADPGDPAWAAVRGAWAALGTQLARDWPLADGAPVLGLRLERGGEVEIPWGPDGAHLDLGAFYEALVSGVLDPLGQRMAGLFRQAAGARLDLLYVIVTGRGSLFPPVVDVLVELTKRHFGLQQARFLQVDDRFLKGIVAYGTSLLGGLTRYAPGLQFQPLSLCKLCVAAGLDPATGRRRLIPIAEGIPRPEDGTCIAAEPLGLRPGNEPRTLEIYLCPRFDGLLEHGRDVALTSLTRNADLNPRDAASARVAVQREPPDCLRVWLTWPGAAASDSPDADWQWLDMGHYSEADGGCVVAPTAAAPVAAVVAARPADDRG